jgi:hypothetical protein
VEIPELTERQLNLIVGACQDIEMNVFCQCNVLPTDDFGIACKTIEAAADVEALIVLKLVKEITEENKEKVEEQNIQTGRIWRVYTVTPLGRALFQAQCSPAVQ